MTPDPLSEAAVPGRHDLTVVRVVNAPRTTVWRLWTTSRHLAEWWGPHSFTNPECSIDPHPGGALRILMRSPDGEDFLNVGTVQVAEPPERLVFTIALLNRDGSTRLENHTTVDLAEQGSATQVTVSVRVLRATSEARGNVAGMSQGWAESLQRLVDATSQGELR